MNVCVACLVWGVWRGVLPTPRLELRVPSAVPARYRCQYRASRRRYRTWRRGAVDCDLQYKKKGKIGLGLGPA
eukprot:1833900-Rhodomonas_salina.1